MSVLAWRLIRENRWRSAARSEALQALAAEPHGGERFTTLDEEELISLRDSRPARLQFDLPVSPPRKHAARREFEPAAEVVFAATMARPSGAPKRRWLALAVVAVVMAAAVSAVYTLYRPVIAAEATRASGPPAAGAGNRPLELLSLRHNTDADGTFTITGLVQNPADGAPFRKVVAIVYLFDRDGNYFAGGKAALDFTTLQPGDESPFVVHVPNASHVSRYRVGFRFEDGGNVAHVDRRGEVPGGTTGNAIDASAPRGAATRKSEGRP
jgi:hypothetical protein